MSDDRSRLDRRRLLRALGATAVAAGLAGCTGDGDSGDGDSGDGDSGDSDSGDSDSGDSSGDSGSGTSTDDGTTAGTTGDGETTSGEGTSGAPDTTSGSPTSSGPATTTGSSGATGDVTADVTLQVRDSQSNVGEFETLEAELDRIELAPESGETVTVAGGDEQVDLAALGPGGSVEVGETTLPAGSYAEGSLYLPVEGATLTGGSEPEFGEMVPTTRSFGEPVDLAAGDSVDLTVTVALLRIAGDGPWTYTVGFGFDYTG